MEPNKTFFEFFKNGTYPGKNIDFLKGFATERSFEYLLFSIYSKKIVTNYWSDEAYFEFLEKAWKDFDPFARKNALVVWQTIMLNGYLDPSNSVLKNIFLQIAKTLGVLFGGAVTVRNLYNINSRLNLEREMFFIIENGPFLITPEFFDELF